jgi:hypothetical protein
LLKEVDDNGVPLRKKVFSLPALVVINKNRSCEDARVKDTLEDPRHEFEGMEESPISQPKPDNWKAYTLLLVVILIASFVKGTARV